MRTFFINSALALTISVTGMPLLAAPSMAQDLELRIGPDGARLSTRDNCDPSFEECRRGSDSYERHADRGCSEGRALDKAERMGIRRARVLSAGRRTIEVGGRARGGDRVSVVFGRGLPSLQLNANWARNYDGRDLALVSGTRCIAFTDLLKAIEQQRRKCWVLEQAGEAAASCLGLRSSRFTIVVQRRV